MGDPGPEAAWAAGLPRKQPQPDAQARAALRDAASGSDEFLREWHVKTGRQIRSRRRSCAVYNHSSESISCFYRLGRFEKEQLLGFDF